MHSRASLNLSNIDHRLTFFVHTAERQKISVGVAFFNSYVAQTLRKAYGTGLVIGLLLQGGILCGIGKGE